MNPVETPARKSVPKSFHNLLLAANFPATSNRHRWITAAVLLIGINSQSGALPAAPVSLFASQSSFPASFYSINQSTGAATVIGNTNSFVPGMDFRSSNGLLYGSSSSLETVNVKTGVATTIAPLPDLMVSIAFSPSDQLYAVNNAGDTLFTLNPLTGSALASVPITGTVHPSGSTFLGEINGIDFAPDGTLYGVGFGLYSINPLTGIATRITPLGTNITGGGAGLLFDDIDFGSDGMLRGVTAGSITPNSQLFTINTSTGVGTFIGLTGFAIDGLASIPTPEPPSVVLLSLGAVGLLVVRFQRRYCWLKRHSSTSQSP
jgi:hypothetical protein